VVDVAGLGHDLGFAIWNEEEVEYRAGEAPEGEPGGCAAVLPASTRWWATPVRMLWPQHMAAIVGRERGTVATIIVADDDAELLTSCEVQREGPS
jgi:hypothetical protein